MLYKVTSGSSAPPVVLLQAPTAADQLPLTQVRVGAPLKPAEHEATHRVLLAAPVQFAGQEVLAGTPAGGAPAHTAGPVMHATDTDIRGRQVLIK